MSRGAAGEAGGHIRRIRMTNQNPGLQAILFDLMGVLLFRRGDYPGDKTVDAVDDMIGGVVDDDAFRKAAMSGLNLDREAFEKVLSRIPDKYEIYPPLWGMLPDLRDNYKLGIINNGTRLTFPYFDAKFKILPISSTSSFPRARKARASRIRKSTCARPGARVWNRERCLFMDDSKNQC